MYFRATSGIMRFLKSLPAKNYSGKLAAAFDTQLQKWYSGNAAKKIEKELKKLSFKVVAPPLLAYVEGKTDNWRLMDGELEKTKDWAQEVANTLLKH
jgi:flavodoxin